MRYVTMMFLLFALAEAGLAHETGPISAYIYKRGDNTHAMRVDDSVRIDRWDDEGGRDYLFVRLEGREYLITDAATLDRVEAAFAPSRAAREERREAKEKLRPLQHEERSVNREMSRLDRDRARAERRGDTFTEYESRKRELENKRERLQREIRAMEPEYKRLERKSSEARETALRRLEDIVRDAVRRGVAKAR